MTTDEALARLRSDWSLGRGDNYLTDEPGWAVCLLMNGKQSQRLGWAKTVAEAIEAAEVKAAEDNRERSERIATVAAGSGYLPEIWEDLAASFRDTNTLLDTFVNRAFEVGVKQHGESIQIRKWP